MNVLYQALNRASMEKENPAAKRPFFSMTKDHFRKKRKRTIILMAVIALLFCLQFVGMICFFIFQVKANNAKQVGATASAIVAPVSTHNVTAKVEDRSAAVAEASASASSEGGEEAKRGQIKHDLVPEDLAQGISLFDVSGDDGVSSKKEKTSSGKEKAEAMAGSASPQIAVRDKAVPQDPLYAKGSDYLSEGSFLKAIKTFDKILAQTPDDKMAMAGKAFALQKMGKNKEAADLDRTLLQLDPNDVKTRANFVSVLVDLNDDESFEELALLVGKQPDFAPGLAGMAKYSLERGKKEDAVDFFQRALDVDPNNDVYRLGLAVAYDRLGKNKEALTLYQDVMKNKKGAESALPLTSPSIEQRIDYLSSQVAP